MGIFSFELGKKYYFQMEYDTIYVTLCRNAVIWLSSANSFETIRNEDINYKTITEFTKRIQT